VRGAQPGQGDHDEPTNRGLGLHTAGRRERGKAVAGKLLGRDVVPNIAGLCRLT
jgi:hypothetical protein